MKWVRFSEQMPSEKRYVLAFDQRSRTTYVVYFYRDPVSDGLRCKFILTTVEFAWNPGQTFYDFTHWMPLPEPPKDELNG